MANLRNSSMRSSASQESRPSMRGPPWRDSQFQNMTLLGCRIAADLFAIASSFLLAFLLRLWAPAFLTFLSPLRHGLKVYLQAWPALLLWPLMFWREGLCPGYWLTARDELPRTVAGSTLAGTLVLAATFVTKTSPQFSRPILVGGWLISQGAVPIARLIMKCLLKAMGTTGPRAVLLDGRSAGRMVLRGIGRQRLPSLSIKAIFDDDHARQGGRIEAVRVHGPLEKAAPSAGQHGISMAIVAMPGMTR